METNEKREIVTFFLKNGILINNELLKQQGGVYEGLLARIKENAKSEDFLFLNQDVAELIGKKKYPGFNWLGLDNARALAEKQKDAGAYPTFLSYLKKEEETTKTEQKKQDIKVIFSYREASKKREIQDFVSYFAQRYKAIEQLLKGRQELKNLTSINRIIKKKDRENLSFVAMVQNKKTTKNGNIMLELEDPTGAIRVLVNKNKQDVYDTAKSMVLDEVVGISGVNGDGIVFANNILLPDITNKELKKSPDEGYAIFLSDFHVGSDHFLGEEFNRFLDWINCSVGNENQKETARKIKYAFIVGDLVDGCGIYPDQEKELATKDIYLQYEECARLIKKIPEHISIVICPGNHDAMRIAEPQLELYKDFSKPLWELPNVTMVSNPAVVNMGSSEKFQGFDVLLYHGYSFDHYVANVDSIRNQGGYKRADLIMKFLLQRRHLAPSHTSTLYIPDANKDPLVIETVPDFFVTGHIHKTSVSNYKNTTLICGSCWQSKTPFQEKMGHDPEPARVPIVNLQTREIKILKF